MNKQKTPHSLNWPGAFLFFSAQNSLKRQILAGAILRVSHVRAKVALMSAKVEVRGTAPGILATQ